MTPRSKRRRPSVSTIPQPRQRSRNFAWWDERERAETVACPPYPKGCRAPIGSTCRNRYGDELINQTAHDARRQLSEQAEPTAGATAPTHDMEDA